MRLFLFIGAVFILLVVSKVPAQQESVINKNDSLKLTAFPKDSVRMAKTSMRNDFALFNPLFSQRFNADFSNSKEVLSFIGKDMRMSADFLSPLYTKYQYDQRMAPYTYILGIAEGAACGYMLYEHVRKYGIWDKKK